MSTKKSNKKVAVKVAVRKKVKFTLDQDRSLLKIEQGDAHVLKIGKLAKKWKIDPKVTYDRWWYLVLGKPNRIKIEQAPTPAGGIVLYVIDNSKEVAKVAKKLDILVPLLSTEKKNNMPVETEQIPIIKDLVSNKWPEMKFRFVKIEDNPTYSRMHRVK